MRLKKVKKVLKNKLLTEKNGITLITLVITIIVLTIIAGIVVASLSSEDKNIVDRSKDSREFTEVEQEKEILQSILIEIDNRYFEDTDAKISYISDALFNEGINNFEIFTDYVSIKDRTYYYSELMPGFNSL